MNKRRFIKPLLALTVVGGVGAAAYFNRDRWMPLLQREQPAASDISPSKDAEVAPENKNILLSDQAIANLALRAKPAQPQTYWKTIQVPGMVVDRPGRSDRNIISPVAGVVTRINFFPGDTVRPGDVLYTIRLLSESLHRTQSDLFKATQDIVLAEAKRKRLEGAAAAIPQSKIIEAKNDITRLEVAVKTYRRELFNRGLTSYQIDDASKGEFVSEIDIEVAIPVRARRAAADDCQGRARCRRAGWIFATDD